MIRSENIGKIIRILGTVIDVQFQIMPPIHTLLYVEEEDFHCPLEVSLQLENGTVRQEMGAKQRTEITLKFGKGCVGDEFKGKDGNSYREILVPNVDKDDRRPWQTFVLKSNHVHENRYGKGMWCKMPMRCFDGEGPAF